MSTEHAMQRRLAPVAERAAPEMRSAGPATSAKGVNVQGPRHAQSMALAAKLNSAPSVQRLAQLAATLNKVAPVRQLAAIAAPPQRGDAAETTATRPVMDAVSRGTLTASQVQMPPLRQDLPIGEVAALAARMGALGGLGRQPLRDAVRAGSATVRETGVQLPGLRAASTGEGLANAVAALRPRDVSLRVQDGRYAVQARLNPWILVVNGTITATDPGPWNKTMPSGWLFKTKNDLRAANVDPDNPVGSAWPQGGGGGGSSYTIPSATYNPNNMSPAFHALTSDNYPMVQNGTAWNRQGQQLHLLRDPQVLPNSPHTQVHEDTGPTGGLMYTSTVSDPTSTGGQRVLSGYTEIASQGHTYQGNRNYPMTSADYTTSGGTVYGRGHVNDHADGTTTTTSSYTNYTPQDQNYNTGARNSTVQEARRSGGGNYREVYSYSQQPARTTDGTAIPTTNHFMVTNSTGMQNYYSVPNTNYPNNRSRNTINQFQQPTTNFPLAPWF
jgi:hypothetical protein